MDCAQAGAENRIACNLHAGAAPVNEFNSFLLW
jgi:hypothetical protein